jgi:REP element-mobilizing transposase RayT
VRRVYEYRRHLPHYQSDHKPILVNFSTHHRWILPEPARSLVLDACLWGNGKRFMLYAVVVMPDHVHLAFMPLYAGDGFFSVAEILQGIKSASAHQIDRLLGRRGQVWQHESFDHVLRCEEGIAAKVEYVTQNPVRAGLVRRAAEYRWLWVCPDLRWLVDDSM